MEIDSQIFIRTSREDLVKWDREQIAHVLIRETYIDPDTAAKISKEIEEGIIRSKIKVLTSSLVRELVDAKLVELGLERAHKMHTRLGVPLYDVDQMILHQYYEETDRVPLGPDATNLVLAQSIKRNYALLNVFTQEVADAHLRGEIHLQGLGFIDRLYASGQSVEYVKKFGLKLPGETISARPARYAMALLSQLVGFTEALRGHFSSSVEWDAVNILFAPYLKGLSDHEVKQLAQALAFELSRQSIIHGGLTVATDLNLYADIPAHLKDVPAIGPGGEYTGKPYVDYAEESQRFLRSILEVLIEGDGAGRTFPLPILVIHLTGEFLQSPRYREFLDAACTLAVQRRKVRFVFDRKECRRAYFGCKGQTEGDYTYPWKNRCFAIQNITLNLPRMAYRARESDLHLFTGLTEMMELIAVAHMQKRVFVEKLLAAGEQGSLGILMMKQDGQSYLRLGEAPSLISVTGLNELVHIHKGFELHESKEALELGLKVMSHLKMITERLSKLHHMPFMLAGTGQEPVAQRFAKLDLRHASPESGHFVKGDIARGEVYYTDSTLLSVTSPLSLFERIRLEGLFHNLLPIGPCSFPKEDSEVMDEKELKAFLLEIFEKTKSEQIAL
jgi:ribonucleoside-triphosphate reductase